MELLSKTKMDDWRHPFFSCMDCYNKYLKQYDYNYGFVKIKNGKKVKE